jgi:hypothetical protein
LDPEPGRSVEATSCVNELPGEAALSKPHNRRIALVALAAVLLLAAGSVWRARHVGIDPEHLETDVRPVTIHSALLGRDMAALVYQPAGFDATRAYPVLYVFPATQATSTAGSRALSARASGSTRWPSA